MYGIPKFLVDRQWSALKLTCLSFLCQRFVEYTLMRFASIICSVCTLENFVLNIGGIYNALDIKRK